jgi:hypothetical protein
MLQFGRGMTEIQKSHSLTIEQMANHEKKLAKELEPNGEWNNGNNLHRLARKPVCRRNSTSGRSQKVADDR